MTLRQDIRYGSVRNCLRAAPAGPRLFPTRIPSRKGTLRASRVFMVRNPPRRGLNLAAASYPSMCFPGVLLHVPQFGR